MRHYIFSLGMKAFIHIGTIKLLKTNFNLKLFSLFVCVCLMCCHQASGVVVDDGVVKAYEEIKVHRTGEVQSDRLKLVMFRLSDDDKSIIVDEENSLRMKDIENVDDVFKKLVSMFPSQDCRYALYDCCYRTKETDKEDLVFIFWSVEMHDFF